MASLPAGKTTSPKASSGEALKRTVNTAGVSTGFDFKSKAAPFLEARLAPSARSPAMAVQERGLGGAAAWAVVQLQVHKMTKQADARESVRDMIEGREIQ